MRTGRARWSGQNLRNSSAAGRGLDFGDDARTRQQRNAAAAGRQHAADEAADAARPCNTDRLARNHFVTYRVASGFKIAERADRAYRQALAARSL